MQQALPPRKRLCRMTHLVARKALLLSNSREHAFHAHALVFDMLHAARVFLIRMLTVAKAVVFLVVVMREKLDMQQIHVLVLIFDHEELPSWENVVE